MFFKKIDASVHSSGENMAQGIKYNISIIFSALIIRGFAMKKIVVDVAKYLIQSAHSLLSITKNNFDTD